MTSSVIGSRLRAHRKAALIRIAGQFINLDMPDPRTNWRQMLACIGFVVLVGAALITLLLVLP